MESKGLTPSFAGHPRRLLIVASLAVAAFLIAIVPAMASARAASTDRLQTGASHHSSAAAKPGTLSSAARYAKKYGYIPRHPARYARQKRRANRHAEATQALASPASGGLLAPTKVRAFAGINDVNAAPPDETSAVGTGRYIELVNSKFAIYNKTANAPIGQGTLNSMMGAGGGDSVFDPQIMWDATTNRFYYAADDVVSAATNLIAYGFSKTANPTSAADWCHGFINAGSTFPDYPKLGDSKDFVMIGTNLFDSSNHYVGSNISASSKPKASDTCASWTSTHKFASKSFSNGFTPSPASEIDSNATGYAVAVPQSLPGNKLEIYKVTRSSAGAPVINSTPTSVTVPSFAIPPDVPQKSSTHKIDSSDTRNTQAQAAIDPGHGNKFALWTQHTVKGGAGSEVRWYEINPATHTLIQSGKATSGSLYDFNGAIAPNRQVNGATKSGGSSMLMHFNTSSSAAFPSIKMVSKVGAGAQSGQVSVFNGTHPVGGFDCDATAPCRWGDYAAATPDPSTPNRIWNVSQYGNGTGNFSNSPPSTSRTWNFIATP